MPSAGRIIWDDDLTPNVRKLGVAAIPAVKALMASQAPRVQDAARRSAPWQDQTGNARNGLFARSSDDGDTMGIDLYHTVPYGIYLETRWGGRYQVIVPTIDSEGRRIMGLAKELFSKMGGM